MSNETSRYPMAGNDRADAAARSMGGSLTEAELAETLAELAVRTKNGNAYFPGLAHYIVAYAQQQRSVQPVAPVSPEDATRHRGLAAELGERAA